MISDSIILAALVLVGTISGALIGLLAEPVTNFFCPQGAARATKKESLR